MAHPPERVADACRVLLPEPAEHLEQSGDDDHGRAARLPFGRERGGTGDGVQGALRRRALLAATEHHPFEGLAKTSLIWHGLFAERRGLM